MEYFPIDKVSEENEAFRQVLWTGAHTQLVVMTIPVGGEIGEEVHAVDQLLSFVSGVATAVIDGEEQKVGTGDLVVVPAGRRHNFVNAGGEPLRLYTVYGPPEHADGVVHRTKEEADRLEAEGKDEPPQD